MLFGIPYVHGWLTTACRMPTRRHVHGTQGGQGSATGARYTHRRPEYLETVSNALEELFEVLSDFVDRPFMGREKVDQPLPDDPGYAVTLQRGRTWQRKRRCSLTY